MTLRRILGATTFALMGGASNLYAQNREQVQVTGVSGLWLLANFCCAGMRAQNHPSFGWRIAAFIFDFPGTILTLFVVSEGEERCATLVSSRTFCLVS